jgi:hypothetical protein
MSVLKLDRVDLEAPLGPELHVSGVDILDGSPVFDIKPYLEYADSVPHASPGWAHQPIERIAVEFAPATEPFLNQLSQTLGQSPEETKNLIVDLLSNDPRPANQKRHYPPHSTESSGFEFGFEIEGWDVRWRISSSGFIVTEIVRLSTAPP